MTSTQLIAIGSGHVILMSADGAFKTRPLELHMVEAHRPFAAELRLTRALSRQLDFAKVVEPAMLLHKDRDEYPGGRYPSEADAAGRSSVDALKSVSPTKETARETGAEFKARMAGLAAQQKDQSKFGTEKPKEPAGVGSTFDRYMKAKSAAEQEGASPIDAIRSTAPGFKAQRAAILETERKAEGLGKISDRLEAEVPGARAAFQKAEEDLKSAMWVQRAKLGETVGKKGGIDAIRSVSHSPEVKAQAAKLKLPGGKGVESIGGGYRWSKRGGYADAIMRKVTDAAQAAGYKKVDTSSRSDATGDYMGHGTSYEHPSGWVLTVDSSYGPTKDYNDHTITLKRK